ncbi:MAG: hypothetical protein AAGI37_15225 [Planctomycetota bacterium]
MRLKEPTIRPNDHKRWSPRTMAVHALTTFALLAAFVPQPSCVEQTEKQEIEVFAVKDAASFKTTVSFNRDIRPILSDKCYNFHGPGAQSREAQLRLDVIEDGEDHFGAYLVIE